jgi:hypothetical protein
VGQRRLTGARRTRNHDRERARRLTIVTPGSALRKTSTSSLSRTVSARNVCAARLPIVLIQVELEQEVGLG